MKVSATELPEVLSIVPDLFGDERGYFMESYNARAFAKAGVDVGFVQDNQSRSALHVLRGLHYQVKQPQAKLVRVLRGSAFDVAVDLRRSSPTFGKWAGRLLSAENRAMLFVPPGFAHGFLALEDGTELLYKCSDFYAPEHERAIAWDDPEIGIDWPLGGNSPILSSKDLAAPRLGDAETYA